MLYTIYMQNFDKVFSARKIATLALFTAMSLITFLIESLFPPLFLPGAKMGLSNVFSLLTLVIYGPVEAICVIVVRTVLGSFFGNVFALAYSFTAGLVSIVLSGVLMKFCFPKLTLLAISIFSAVAHNVVQVFVCYLLTDTQGLFSYLPYLALCGVLAGVIVGLTVIFLIKAIPTSIYKKMLHA